MDFHKTASDDEAEASKRFAQSASDKLTDADSGVPYLREGCQTAASYESRFLIAVIVTAAANDEQLCEERVHKVEQFPSILWGGASAVTMSHPW